MAKSVIIILVHITQLFISGTLATPDTYRLSEKQIEGLKNIATQWKDVISSEKNPCEEFYDYVCNNHDYPTPEKMKRKDNDDDILKEILSENPEVMTESEEKYLKYSTTCQEFTQDEKDELIKWYKMENSIGNWPAFEENWDDSKFNLPLAIVEMNSYHYPVVFTLNLEFDTPDGFKTSFQIKENLLGIENRKEMFKTQFERLGIRNPEEILTDAALFEKTYDEVVESQKSSTDLKIMFSQLKDFIPEMEWGKQLETIYGETPLDTYPVVIKSHEKLKAIYHAISKLSPKVIANYFFCVFVYNANSLLQTRASTFFKPVIKQGFLKHIYDQNEKEILKGMYITILELFQNQNLFQDFKTNNNSKQIVEFIREDLFALPHDEDLDNEFKDISANSNECMKNYYRLQRLYVKRDVTPYFSSKNTFATLIRRNIDQDLVYLIPKFIEEPSPFLFKRIIFSILINIVENASNATILTSSTMECFSKKFTKDITNDDMKTMLTAQLILKGFTEWTKNYPVFVQEENNYLKEYGLSAEELLVLSTQKYTCKDPETFNMVMTAFANSIEFKQIYDCPVGSKLNVAKKCSFGSYGLD